MSIDPAEVKHDLYPGNPREHDERVQVGGWVYYIRGVRLRSELKGSQGEQAAWLAHPAAGALASLRRVGVRRRGWLVGVVRMGAVETWNDRTPQIVHAERLGRGVDPAPRIAHLKEAAARGGFAPDPANSG